MTYVSTFLGTQLYCEYEAGTGIFRSDNISTISILQDVIVKLATLSNTAIKISSDPKYDSVQTTLLKLLPLLEAQQKLDRQVDLIEPLKELQSQEGTTDFMSEEQLEIIQNAEKLKFEFKQHPALLDRLYGMITDLFIDANRYALSTRV